MPFVADLIGHGEATDLFARERGDGFDALLANLDQSIFGEPAYPSVEAKAAHLLYFVVKNHPFTDGKKRSAAFLFVDFLQRNGFPVAIDTHRNAVVLPAQLIHGFADDFERALYRRSQEIVGLVVRVMFVSYKALNPFGADSMS